MILRDRGIFPYSSPETSSSLNCSLVFCPILNWHRWVAVCTLWRWHGGGTLVTLLSLHRNHHYCVRHTVRQDIPSHQTKIFSCFVWEHPPFPIAQIIYSNASYMRHWRPKLDIKDVRGPLNYYQVWRISLCMESTLKTFPWFWGICGT